MRPLSQPWRNLLFASLILAALVAGLGRSLGEAAKAISFVFSDLDGRTVRLADYKGKWVLVSFWAPWCPLCKIQVPSLNTLNQRGDFRVVGVALDYGADEDGIRQAANLAGMRFEALVAGGSRRDPSAVMRQVGPVDFFPTSYLYDPTGEIVMFIPGQLRLNRVLAFMESWQSEHGPARAPTLAAKVDKLAAQLRQRYGERGAQAFSDWKRMLDAALPLAAGQRLSRVNDYFNRQIQVGEDMAIWRRADYWTTPGELLAAGRGDSEDFAIAKYFTLLALNVAPEKLRLVYVRVRGDAARMVLAYYDSPGAEPLILDHRNPEILPAGKRPDLQPVYSFNSLGVWEETASAASGGDPGRMAVWEDTLRRARAEGFE